MFDEAVQNAVCRCRCLAEYGDQRRRYFWSEAYKDVLPRQDADFGLLFSLTAAMF